jgi:hypothetical protein
VAGRTVCSKLSNVLEPVDDLWRVRIQFSKSLQVLEHVLPKLTQFVESRLHRLAPLPPGLLFQLEDLLLKLLVELGQLLDLGLDGLNVNLLPFARPVGRLPVLFHFFLDSLVLLLGEVEQLVPDFLPELANLLEVHCLLLLRLVNLLHL